MTTSLSSSPSTSASDRKLKLKSNFSSNSPNLNSISTFKSNRKTVSTPQTLFEMAYSLHLTIRPSRLSSRRGSSSSVNGSVGIASLAGWEAGERALGAIGSRIRKGKTVGDALGLSRCTRKVSSQHTTNTSTASTILLSASTSIPKANAIKVEIEKSPLEVLKSTNDTSPPMDVEENDITSLKIESDTITVHESDEEELFPDFKFNVWQSETPPSLDIEKEIEMETPDSPRLGPIESPQIQPSPFPTSLMLGAAVEVSSPLLSPISANIEPISPTFTPLTPYLHPINNNSDFMDPSPMPLSPAIIPKSGEYFGLRRVASLNNRSKREFVEKLTAAVKSTFTLSSTSSSSSLSVEEVTNCMPHTPHIDPMISGTLDPCSPLTLATISPAVLPIALTTLESVNVHVKSPSISTVSRAASLKRERRLHEMLQPVMIREHSFEDEHRDEKEQEGGEGEGERQNNGQVGREIREAKLLQSSKPTWVPYLLVGEYGYHKVTRWGALGGVLGLLFHVFGFLFFVGFHVIDLLALFILPLLGLARI